MHSLYLEEVRLCLIYILVLRVGQGRTSRPRAICAGELPAESHDHNEFLMEHLLAHGNVVVHGFGLAVALEVTSTSRRNRRATHSVA